MLLEHPVKFLQQLFGGKSEVEKQCILAVDDDKETVRAISAYLGKEGYDVLCMYDGVQAADSTMGRNTRLILIDVTMPRQNGSAAILEIRETHNPPIIVLSAKLEDSDKILSLSTDAGDYVTKPLNSQELVARVKLQLRHYITLGDINSTARDPITIGRLALDMDNRTLTVDGELVRLTAAGTEIVESLMKDAGRTFSAGETYQRTWDEPAFSAENTVTVYVHRIREKIKISPKEPEYLKVVWGTGYRIDKS